MSDLGLWTPYIDLDDMRSWYPKLPGNMEQELLRYTPKDADFEPLGEREFRRVYAAAVACADASVAKLKLPYHNPDHFRKVAETGMKILDAYERLTRRKVPLAVRQAARIALYKHDENHCGSTLRADAKVPLWRPELGTKVSLEWTSTVAINEFGISHNLPLLWRLFMVGLVFSSTYGGEAAKQRGIATDFPTPNPRSFWFAIMPAADVSCDNDIKKVIRDNIAVNMGEIPATGQPSTVLESLKGLTGFLGHVEAAGNRLNVTSGVKIAEHLGWPRVVASHRKSLQAILDGRRPELLRYAEAEALRYAP